MGELRDSAERRGFDLAGEYVDLATGRTEEGSQYRQLLGDVRRRKPDAVLVWNYDRFARSLAALVKALEKFRALSLDFMSQQEQVDTTNAQGELIFGIMASLSQFGSRLIGDRVKAGLARAKAQGKHVRGRRIAYDVCEKIHSLAGDGLSPRQIAGRVGVSHQTVRNYLLQESTEEDVAREKTS